MAPVVAEPVTVPVVAVYSAFGRPALHAVSSGEAGAPELAAAAVAAGAAAERASASFFTSLLWTLAVCVASKDCLEACTDPIFIPAIPYAAKDHE